MPMTGLSFLNHCSLLRFLNSVVFQPLPNLVVFIYFVFESIFTSCPTPLQLYVTAEFVWSTISLYLRVLYFTRSLSLSCCLSFFVSISLTLSSSLFCVSLLYFLNIFLDLASASKLVYQSVFHYNYIHYTSFIFLCVGRHDCISISMILSLLFLFAIWQILWKKKR